MISVAQRIPNFAGVALVDILANGVAVLIIVIVLSIASRFEQEKEYSERIQEISAVMTREFSTSLVLNRLAAGPPAMLHDYENSPLDRIWDPRVMPVLEIHKDGVRDPYSGYIWSRTELLQEPNSLDTFLSNFDELQRTSVRGDFYDIGAFYLLMSILKDHDITIAHWHFIGASGDGQMASLANCPPGMSAEDCTGIAAGEQSQSVADVYESLTNGDGQGEQDTGTEWPPGDSEWRDQDDIGSLNAVKSLPQGAQLGPGTGLDNASFPDVRATRNRMLGRGSDGAGVGGSQGVSIRLADPTLQAMPMTGIELRALQQKPEMFLVALMAFLDSVQKLYDQNAPPTELLQQFIEVFTRYLEAPPVLSDAQMTAIEDLAMSLALVGNQTQATGQSEPLLVTPMPISAHAEAYMRVAVNRLLIDAEIQSNHDIQLEAVPAEGKLRFNLQAYPDIWRGVQVTLDRNAALLMSPHQSDPATPKWRAVAYLSPQQDDFVVGFVHSTYDEDGFVEIVAETNESLVDTMRLLPQWERNPFSIQSWMTLLYMAAGLALITLLFFWRPGTRLRQ